MPASLIVLKNSLPDMDSNSGRRVFSLSGQQALWPINRGWVHSATGTGDLASHEHEKWVVQNVCVMFLWLIQTLSFVYVCDITARVRCSKDIVQVAVVAKLQSVLAAVCNADRLLADVHVSGLLLFAIAFHSFRQYIQGGPKKSGPFLKVHNSCIWWHRKAINIPKCSALYQE